ncbi:MarR family transcriptional regulator, partial [Streptomyces noursei]
RTVLQVAARALRHPMASQIIPDLLAEAARSPADAGSLAASELARHLQVSPASISKAIAFLEGQGLVRRERDDRRRERYVVDDDVWYQAMRANARANARLAAAARRGVDVLGPGTPAAARFEGIARFVDVVGAAMARAAEQARDVLHGEPGAASGGAAAPRADHP